MTNARRERAGLPTVHLVSLALLLWGLLWPAVAARCDGLMLPQVDAGQQDVRGWLMSEKLDGMRGSWDGKQLLSKNGHRLYPPAAFVAGLPPFPLEGEIWGGRGRFEQTVASARKEHPHDGWIQLRFAIFDVPQAPGGFSERIALASAWFAAHPSAYAFVIDQIPVRDRDHLQQELQRVEELGGEGLIVRCPDALYASGRSPAVLKVKNFQDAEAAVVAHLPGTGRNAGRLGALLVEEKDGTQFRLGSGFKDAERESPPPVGALVTFKYYGRYDSGIPRFPSFMRIRRDRGL